VGPFAPDQCRWVIEPLLDAGVELEHIRTLVFRIGFDAIVDGGTGSPQRLNDVVRDEPEEVRAAWAATLCRLLVLADPVR
jgi:hypothetical protein